MYIYIYIYNIYSYSQLNTILSTHNNNFNLLFSLHLSPPIFLPASIHLPSPASYSPFTYPLLFSSQPPSNLPSPASYPSFTLLSFPIIYYFSSPSSSSSFQFPWNEFPPIFPPFLLNLPLFHLNLPPFLLNLPPFPLNLPFSTLYIISSLLLYIPPSI